MLSSSFVCLLFLLFLKINDLYLLLYYFTFYLCFLICFIVLESIVVVFTMKNILTYLFLFKIIYMNCCLEVLWVHYF